MNLFEVQIIIIYAMVNNRYGIMQEVGIIGLSIFIAALLVKINVSESILIQAKEIGYLGSFIAGIFFTSVFTTAPAIVVLGEIAQINSVILTALFGAIGAVFGDLFILHIIRDRFSKDLADLLLHTGWIRKLRRLAQMKVFRYLNLVIGGLIIASPLPDELGVSLLGFSRIKTKWFALISLIFNFIGILLIGLAARSL